MKAYTYRAIISSDWNQCLAPCGPFDPIIYNYPDVASDLITIFEAYTGNIISLGTANRKIKKLLPKPISIQQMDRYLDNSFITYKGVPDLIDWCLKHNILFMINTTGFVGYFQRIFAKHLLPKIPVISANPMIRHPFLETDPSYLLELDEIQDKGKNTETAMEYFGFSGKKVVIIGDSGGDGPHFKWGAEHTAYLIGSMAKPSLTNYCNQKKIKINLFFGSVYAKGEKRNAENEMNVDFMELSSVFQKIFA
ncbi:hypothetical protein ACFLZM_03895 [Thermodesulfobacteriota bacterium]